jgi:NAD(P)-dependent dehydrogenase (short-subunit alcohol dehydrogenase family)
MGDFKEKVVVITGGTSGIGLGIAHAFIEQGAKVVIFGRNEKRIKSLKNNNKSNLLAVRGDVCKPTDLSYLFEKTKERFGFIDCLVINAGIAKRLAIDKISIDDFDAMVNTNLRAAFLSAKLSLDFMNHASNMLLIASCAAHITFKHHSAYSATKAAIIKLTQNLAFDLSDRKIRVNSISPGYIDTPIFDECKKECVNYLEKKAQNIPLKRVGAPQDIANAALFLASHKASYITGADLLVDGGYASSFTLDG